MLNEKFRFDVFYYWGITDTNSVVFCTPKNATIIQNSD